MQHQSIWARLTEWFTNDLYEGPRHAPSNGRQNGLNDDLRINRGSPGNGSTNVARVQPRAQAIEKLEQGYEKLIGLVDNLNSHLEHQHKGTEHIVTAVNELSETVTNLSRLPSQLENQQKTLDTISRRLESLETINLRLNSLDNISKAWNETADQLPKIAESHRESLDAVRTQIESSTTIQQQVSESMTTLEETVSTFGSASVSATESLRELQAASANRDNDLIAVLQDQNKKFTALMIVGIAVTIVMAAGVLIIALS